MKLELLLKGLSETSNEAKTAVSSRLFVPSPEAKGDISWKAFDADIREQTEGMSGDDKVITIEMALKKRRAEFAKLALPMIKQKATQEALVKSIGDSVSGLESTIITMLITSPVIQVKSTPSTVQTLQTAQTPETAARSISASARIRKSSSLSREPAPSARGSSSYRHSPSASSTTTPFRTWSYISDTQRWMVALC